MPSVADKRRAFHELHKSGCFVIPNPWDIGSVRYLEHLGFKALATTSAGFAFSQAYPDHEIMSRDVALAHFQAVVAATDLPVNADFEGGFAHDPAGVAESVRLAIETGVSGLSIEDATYDKAKPLYDFDHAVARVRAARQAIDRAGGDTLLVGRSEGFIAGAPDLDETIRRLKAYAAAGADCLYAPGIKRREEIAAIVSAVAPKPINVVIGAPIGLTVADVAALGVRRISLGCALARAAWGGFMRAVSLIARDGKFDGLAEAASNAELNRLFAEDRKRRPASSVQSQTEPLGTR